MGIASLSTSNAKVLYFHDRRNRHRSHQTVTLKTDLGVVVNEPEAQAELLNKFHDSAFHPDNGKPNSALPIPPTILGNQVFLPCIIHKEFSTLDTATSPGHYQLHSKILKLLATFFAEPQADLFNN